MDKYSKYSNLKKITKNNYENKDRGDYISFFELPTGTELYKMVEGINKFDIIPYEIKHQQHPLVKKGVANIGDIEYTLEVYIHKNIGISKGSYMCMSKTYGKPCPICDKYNEEKAKGASKSILDAFRFTRYNFYNIDDFSGKNKIFLCSYHYFEKELLKEASLVKPGEIITFSHPLEGKTIKFRGFSDNYKGKDYIKPERVDFLDRDYQIDDDVLSSAIALESLIKLPSKQELENILIGINSDNNEDTQEVIKQSASTCPFGHLFGDDVNNSIDCDTCPNWQACQNEYDKNNED